MGRPRTPTTAWARSRAPILANRAGPPRRWRPRRRPGPGARRRRRAARRPATSSTPLLPPPAPGPLARPASPGRGLERLDRLAHGRVGGEQGPVRRGAAQDVADLADVAGDDQPHPAAAELVVQLDQHPGG